MSKSPGTTQLSSSQALALMKQGNARFATGVSSFSQEQMQNRRAQLQLGQAPFAIVLGCSDSRVPAEFVFDVGLGDLFVIRIAGNIVAPSQIGSVELAVERFGTPLIVVLGHTQCGAISAAVESLLEPFQASECIHMGSIVKRIQPSVKAVLEANPNIDSAQLEHKAGRANIHASVAHLRHSSEFIENAILSNKLAIIGAEYAVETGTVTFFDES